MLDANQPSRGLKLLCCTADRAADWTFKGRLVIYHHTSIKSGERQIDEWIVTIGAVKAQISGFCSWYQVKFQRMLDSTLPTMQHSYKPNNIQCPDSLLPQFLCDKLRCHVHNERPLHLSLFPDWRMSDNERHLAHSSHTNKSEGFRKLSVLIWNNWKKTRMSGMKRYADTSSKVLFIKPSIPREVTSFKQTLCLNVAASITCRHVEGWVSLWALGGLSGATEDILQLFASTDYRLLPIIDLMCRISGVLL